jgi:phosphoglycolate phosphatase
MKKMILFDMDGTLLDTFPALAIAMEKAYKHYFPNKEYNVCLDKLRDAVSYGRDALTAVAFNRSNPPKEWGLYAEQVYSDIMLENTDYFDGIKNILLSLMDKNISYGIVTSKPYNLTSQLCGVLPLLQEAKVVICPEHVSRCKPHPEPLLLACEKSDSTLAESIYIGDSDSDIESAKACGMDSILVKYGYLYRGADISIISPTYIAEDVDELLRKINELVL